MCSGDNIALEITKSSILFNADTVWNADDETLFKRNNLEAWVQSNLVQSVAKSNLSDCFAVLRYKLNKTVLHVIPFSHVDELCYYKFDECNSLSISVSVKCKCELSPCQQAESCVEPWMFPEVEESFKLLCSGIPSPFNTVGYKLKENGYASHADCGKFCPFSQIKSVLCNLFGNARKGDSRAEDDGSVDLELDVLTKEKDVVGKEPLRCPFSGRGSSYEEVLKKYRGLLLQAKHAEIVYSVCKQETVADPEGALLYPVSEENEGFSQAFCKFMSQEEYKNYKKICSESVKSIWTRVIPEVRNKRADVKLKDLNKCSQVAPGSKSHITGRNDHQINTCHFILPPKVEYFPSKPPGLNVEVPEFHPRKDDIRLTQGVSQLYFPSGSSDELSRHLFPYIATTWGERKFNPNPSPSLNITSVTDVTHIPGPLKNTAGPYGLQYDFQGNLLHQYQPQNFLNQQQHILQQQNQILQQQQQANVQCNFLLNQHMSVLPSQPLLFPGTDRPTAPGCQNLLSGTPFEQQVWMASTLRNQYHQPLRSQPLTRADQSMYVSQPIAGFQPRTAEMANQFSQKIQNDINYLNINPQASPMNTNMNLIKNQIDDNVDQHSSPPKNIPVYQRPPESYNFTAGDSNGRRRSSCGTCGGGGAVLSNLIVLTKGGGRWKNTRHQTSDHGLRDKGDKDFRLGRAEEKSGIPSADRLSENVENVGKGSHFQEFSDCTSAPNTVASGLNGKTLQQNISEEISTIGFESKSANSSIYDTMPMYSSMVTPEKLNISYDPEGCSADDTWGQESDGGIKNFQRECGKGMHQKLTSTPIKSEESKEGKTEPLKWLDVASSIENLPLSTSAVFTSEDPVTPSPKRSGRDTGEVLLASCTKHVQASKSLENSTSQWNDVKATFSNPSFPPIQNRRFCGSRAKQSDTNITPTSCLGGQRRLYSDVLVPRGGFLPSICKDSEVLEVSSSVDSLEKRFGELEKVALEQYQSQSSEDSLTRAYHELEIEALEQYRCSCESEIRFVGDRGSTSMKEDRSEFMRENVKRSSSSSLGILEARSSTHISFQNKAQSTKPPASSTSERPTVVTLHSAENSENFLKTTSSTSLAGEEKKKETKDGKTCLANSSESGLLCPKGTSKSEREVLINLDNGVSGASQHVPELQIPPNRTKSRRSKNSAKTSSLKNEHYVVITERNPSANDTNERNSSDMHSLQWTSLDSTRTNLPRIPQSADRNGATNASFGVQQEAPNEQRTQASTTSGTKSEDMKEDPVQEKSLGVPEAWVHYQDHLGTSDQRSEVTNEVSTECARGYDCCNGNTSVDHGKKRKRRKSEKRCAADNTTEAEDCDQTLNPGDTSFLGKGVIERHLVEKVDLTVDETRKTGRSKKSKRGNRRKNKKNDLCEGVDEAEMFHVQQNHSEVTSFHCRKVFDVPSEKLKVTHSDCRRKEKTPKMIDECCHIKKDDLQGNHQVIQTNCVTSVSPKNISSEKIQNFERIYAKSDETCDESNKDAVSRSKRKRRRNRKHKTAADLVNVLSKNDVLLHEENSELFLNRCLNEDNSSNAVKGRNSCQVKGDLLIKDYPGHIDSKLLEDLREEIIQREFSREAEVSMPHSKINFEYPLAHRKDLQESHSDCHESLAFGDDDFNFMCDCGVGKVINLMSMGDQRNSSAKLLKESFVREIVSCDSLEETKSHLAHIAQENERGELDASCVNSIFGQKSQLGDRAADIESQLIVPCLCASDMDLEGKRDYDFTDIGGLGDAVYPVSVSLSSDDFSGDLDFQHEIENLSELPINSMTGSMSMNHFGLSMASYDDDGVPSKSCQGINYPTQSSSKVSRDSTPRTSRSSASTKSSSSSPSVLLKLIRSGKKSRKTKGAGCNGASGRQTPSCTLQ